MNTPPMNPDTPRKPSGRQHIDLDIEAARTVVVEDLGDIPQVSVEFFIESVLPDVKLSESDIERVRNRLQTKDKVSRHFPKAPNNTVGAEPQVFAPLKKIFDTIVRAFRSKTRRPRVKYVHRPGNTPGSERANSSRPDSYLELLIAKSRKGLTSASAWVDIPLVFEEKKSDAASEVLDNDRKIIWSGHHMLSNDPCRRFAFGITIENEQMKLWLFARSHAMVSEPFNWRQDPSTLIRVFGKLAFGSDVDLGYDPTMTRFLDPSTGKIQYKIEVEGKVYVTKKTLADLKSDPIRGRATRVWETYLQGDKSKTSVALKDIWIDSDSDLEGDLQKQLIKDLEKLPKHPRDDGDGDDEERHRASQHPNYLKEAYVVENPAQYFLTVVAHGLVKINGAIDDTKDLMMRGNDVPSEKIYQAEPLPVRAARATISGSDRSYSVGSTPYYEDDAPAPQFEPTDGVKRFQPKKHYRIVFLEVGTPIHDLTSFSEIFKALSDITRAIHYLYLLGYVHRDISTGNILFYMGGGKLCDLEFAKHITTDSSHEVKTGTADFIAVEIRDQEYHFIVVGDGFHVFDDHELDEHPVLQYNTLHDLESTWWIALWMLFFKGPLTGIALPPDHDDNRDDCFPPDYHAYGHRESILADGFEDGLDYLPEELKFLGDLLEKGRLVLTINYTKAETKRPVAVAKWWHVHEHMGRIFSQIRENCADIDKLWAAEIVAEKRRSEALKGGGSVGASSVDADPPKKRQNTGSMAAPPLPRSVRSQFSTKTHSQKRGRRTPPGSGAEPAYHTRSHGPSGSKSAS